MADKFQSLLDAALTGDKAKVDQAIADANFNILELMMLPRQFDQLDTATKETLAGVYQQHPDILPEATKPFVDKALEGITPRAMPVPPETVPPSGSAAGASTDQALTSVPVPRLREDLPAGSVPQTATASTGSVSQDTVDYIAKREGFTPTAYKDGDHYSIGYGTYATPEEVRSGAPISQTDAMARLAQEASQAAAYVDSIAKVPLTDNQRTALISMAYNVGSFGPGLIAAINSGDPDAVTAAMAKYTGAQDPAMAQGVANRRNQEIATYRTPGATTQTPGTALAYAGTKPGAAGAPFDAVLKTPAGITPPIPTPRPASPTGPQASGTTPPNPTLRPPDLGPAAEQIYKNGELYGKGSQGQDVAELQRFLNAKGATDDKGRPLEVDGDFGNSTRQAVKEYQRSHPELVADGVVGPRTIAAMQQDQQVMQQQAQAAASGAMGGEVPRILTPLGLTDPVTDAMTSLPAEQAAAAAIALGKTTPADIFSGPARASAQLGNNLGGYIGNAKDFIANMPDTNPANPFGGPTVNIGGFGFHPGETPDLSGHSRAVFNELGFGYTAPSDPLRSGSGVVATSDATNAATGEIVYNATTAAARRLLDGPPPGFDENAPEVQQVGFVPPPPAEPGVSPDATVGGADVSSPAPDTSGGDTSGDKGTDTPPDPSGDKGLDTPPDPGGDKGIDTPPDTSGDKSIDTPPDPSGDKSIQPSLSTDDASAVLGPAWDDYSNY